jgi:hypothetical protein
MREYRAVLLDPSDRKWALEAGRRMYMLGVFYGYPEALEEGSLQAWIGTLQDTEFLATVAPYSGEDPLRRIAQMHRLDGREDAAMKEEVSATEEVSAVAAAVESAVGSGEAPSAPDPGVAEPAADAVRPPLPGAGEPVAAKVAEPASAHPARTETRSRPEAPSVSPVAAGRGSLHVQAPARQLQVFLDGTPLGPLREEPFQDLEPGEYRLELRGDGRELPPVYALASVEIRAGELTRLSAEPLPYGEIEYRLPETAVAVVVGPAGEVILEGAGQLRFLPAGEYTIEVRRQGYERLELTASLVEGQIFPLSPQLRRLAPAEEPPGRGTGVAAPQPNVLPAGADRASTPRGFPPEGELPPSGSGEAAGIGGGGTPLPGYNPESRLSALIAEREALQQRLERARRSRKGLTVGAWVSYGVGAAALGGMGAAIYFGNQSHQDYQAAIYTEDAVALREQTQTYQLIAVVSGIFGGLGVGGGTLFAALSPQLRRIENRVELLDREISRLRR